MSMLIMQSVYPPLPPFPQQPYPKPSHHLLHPPNPLLSNPSPHNALLLHFPRSISPTNLPLHPLSLNLPHKNAFTRLNTRPRTFPNHTPQQQHQQQKPPWFTAPQPARHIYRKLSRRRRVRCRQQLAHTHSEYTGDAKSRGERTKLVSIQKFSDEFASSSSTLRQLHRRHIKFRWSSIRRISKRAQSNGISSFGARVSTSEPCSFKSGK